MALDKETVRAANPLEEVIPALLGVPLSVGAGRREPLIRCPLHDDRNPSCRVNLAKQTWFCDVCKIGGDVFALVQHVQRVDFQGALRWLADRSGVSAVEPRIVCAYDYHAADGTLLFQVTRWEPKDFRQRRPDGQGGFINNMTGVRRVPYRLHWLKGKPAVVVTEGEKDADALWQLRIPATTNAGGAGKWTDDLTQQLLRAGVERVVVIPDNDDKGREHAEAVAQSCLRGGLSVKLLALPDLPPKGDVSDYLRTHSREDLVTLLQQAPPYTAPQTPSASTPASGPIVVCLADVEPEEISWIWLQRLAKGKLTILLGDPGVGKSTLSLDVAARITRGAEWPDGGRAPRGSVVLLACEDGLKDTVRPRVDRQGGDPSRVHAITAMLGEDGTERHFSLDRDLPHLATVIDAHKPVLVIIDPLSAYFGTERDSYKDTEVRAVLAPLAALAERTETAVLGLMHMNKSANQKALYRGLGGIGFIGQARISLAAGKDPDSDRCLLMGHKENICPRSETLAYRFDGGDRRLVWEAEPVAGVNIEAVLSGSAAVPNQDHEDAVAFLRTLLEDGQMAQTEVERAGKGEGFSISQLRRAKRGAGVESEKSGFRGGVWYWRLAGSNVTDRGEHAAEDDGLRSRVIFGENVPVSPLESTPFPKMTPGVTFVASSTVVSPSVAAVSGPFVDGWGEV